MCAAVLQEKKSRATQFLCTAEVIRNECNTDRTMVKAQHTVSHFKDNACITLNGLELQCSAQHH